MSANTVSLPPHLAGAPLTLAGTPCHYCASGAFCPHKDKHFLPTAKRAPPGVRPTRPWKADLDVAEVRGLYVDELQSVSMIAQALGTSKGSVYRVLHKEGLVRTASQTRRLTDAISISREELWQLFVVERRSQADIARTKDVPVSRVELWLKRHVISASDLPAIFLEREDVLAALRRSEGSEKVAARTLGVSRPVFDRHLLHHGVKEGRPDPGPEELRLLYVDEGRSRSALAAYLCVPETVAHDMLSKHAIPVRESSPPSASSPPPSYGKAARRSIRRNPGIAPGTRKVQVDAQLLAQRHAAGATFEQLSAEFGVGPITIAARIREVAPDSVPRRKRRSDAVAVDVDTMHEQYYIKGMSFAQLGKVHGVSSSLARRRVLEEQRRREAANEATF